MAGAGDGDACRRTARTGGLTMGWELTGSHPLGAWQWSLLAVAALAMGLQTAAMRHVGTTLSTTYLTGTLTSAVASLASRRQSLRHTRLKVAVLVALAAGAAGGALLAALPATLPVLPVSAVAAVVTIATTGGTPSLTRPSASARQHQ